jgi:hypothetical protein
MKSKMTTLTVTEDQLKLIQYALDFYSRVGIGQMEAILEHPTFESTLMRANAPIKEIQVGDITTRGEVVEMSTDESNPWIKTKGSWGNGEEIKYWTDVENIKLSPNWESYHLAKDKARNLLCEARNILTGKNLPINGSYGIYNPNVDESCRSAYDLVQIIRHEFWKNQPESERLMHTVASSVHLSSKDSELIKISVD